MDTTRIDGETRSSIMHKRSQRGTIAQESKTTDTTTARFHTPARHSIRTMVSVKKVKPTLNIQHRLFLQPTLARQARRYRERKRERGKEDFEPELSEDEQSEPKQQDSVTLSDQALRRSSRQPKRKKYFGDQGSEQGHKLNRQPMITGPKKKALPPHAAAKRRSVSVSSSRVAKAPKRKMSAMVPDRALSCRAATFRSCRDDELSVPDGAEDLIAQADMARKKKKKKKRKKKQSRSLFQDSRGALNGVGRVEETEMGGAILRAPSVPLTSQPAITPAKQVTPSRTVVQDHAADDEVKVVGQPPATAQRPTKQPLQTAAAGLQGHAIIDSARVSAAELACYRRSLETAVASERAVALMVGRKQYTLDYLLAANNFAAVFSGLAAMDDLFQEEDFSPSFARILLDVQTIGTLLLTRLLTEHVISPRNLGGLGCSELEARVIVNRVVDQITPILLGSMVILPEQLLPTRLTLSEILQILPALRTIAEEVRRKYFLLTDQLLALCSTPLVARPTGTASPLPVLANHFQMMACPMR